MRNSRQRRCGAPRAAAGTRFRHASNPSAARSWRTSRRPDQVLDVLDEDPRRFDRGDDVAEPGPAPPLLGGTTLSSGDGMALAGEPTGDKVHSKASMGCPPGECGSGVIVARHHRAVFGEYASAERVDLDLPDDGHGGAFEPEVQLIGLVGPYQGIFGMASTSGMSWLLPCRLPPVNVTASGMAPEAWSRV
jgi:hypothetical protein